MLSTRNKRKIRLAGRIFFFFYILLLIYFLFFAEWYGRDVQVHQEPQYNLIPFLEIHRFWVYREQIGIRNVFLNLAGNVIGFIPFGLALPIIFRRQVKGKTVVLLGMTMSVLVEAMQLIGRVGSCDVDDVILNTLGAFLGYIIYKAVRLLYTVIVRIKSS